MDSFNVVITEHALEQLENYIDYLQYTLLNEQAAYSVARDAEETIERLETLAGSLGFCKDPHLRSKGFRTIKLTKHKYVMIYRTENNTAIVEAVYHQMQDYEATFAGGLEEA